MRNNCDYYDLFLGGINVFTATKIAKQTMPPQRRHWYERGGTLCLRSGGMSGEKVNRSHIAFGSLF